MALTRRTETGGGGQWRRDTRGVHACTHGPTDSPQRFIHFFVVVKHGGGVRVARVGSRSWCPMSLGCKFIHGAQFNFDQSVLRCFEIADKHIDTLDAFVSTLFSPHPSASPKQVSHLIATSSISLSFCHSYHCCLPRSQNSKITSSSPGRVTL